MSDSADVEKAEPDTTQDSVVDDDDALETTAPPRWRQYLTTAWKFFLAYDFPILLLAGIGLAKAYPDLGAVYLAPQYTSTWIAVAIIFFISGLGLQTEDFAVALQNCRFNVYVQVVNLGLVSAVVFGVSRALKATGALSAVLSDGLIACGSLPMAINAVSVLSVASHGDEATAIFNEAFGNMIGIFISPLLIRGYLGASGNASLPTILWKLIVRVLVPLLAGQVLRRVSKPVADFRAKHKVVFARINKYLLVFIVYTIFCKTFKKNAGNGVANAFILLLVIFILQLVLLTFSWFGAKLLFSNTPRLRVVGLFGCVAKTIALGIPLIGSLYEGNPNVGLYTLPILIWHPMLLVIGSVMTSRLAKIIDSEVERLEALKGEDDSRKPTNQGKEMEEVPVSNDDKVETPQVVNESDVVKGE